MGGNPNKNGATDMSVKKVLLPALAALVIASCHKEQAQNTGSSSSPPPAPSQPPMIQGMVPLDAIVITDTGSTNTIGLRIVIGRDGTASYVTGAGRGSAHLSDALYKKLKYDVVMASPLSHVRARPDCMKPVSIAIATYIALGDEKSED